MELQRRCRDLLSFGLANGEFRFAAVGPDEALRTVHHHLRCVDEVFWKPCSVGSLSFCRGGEGERVAPTEVVPICNVERKREDVVAPRSREIREQGVGRRTGRATLGGE